MIKGETYKAFEREKKNSTRVIYYQIWNPLQMSLRKINYYQVGGSLLIIENDYYYY